MGDKRLFRFTREHVIALLAFAVPVAIYCTSAQRYVQFWDTGEFQTVPYILGIAHPTGFPAYILLGFVFSHIVGLGSVALRMSVFSGVCVGVACAALYVALRRWDVNQWCAAVAVALFAFGPVTLVYAVRAEVHTLALCFESLAVLCALDWCKTSDRRALVLAAGFEGLALATHPVAIWLLPGLLLFVLAGRQRFRRSEALGAIVALIAPLLLYVYLPVRSAIVSRERFDPTLALGIPPGGAFWDYAHPADLHNFWWTITGAQFHREAGFSGFFAFSHYAQYFSTFAQLATSQFGQIFVLFALLGIYALWRRNAGAALALLVSGVLFVPFALAYAEEADKPRYLLETFWINAAFLALGLDLIVKVASKRIKFAGALLGVVAGAAAINQIRTQPDVFFAPQNTAAVSFVRRIIDRTPQNAVIVAPWIYVTPIGYCAYVERRCGNRIPYNAHIEGSVTTIKQVAVQRPTYVVLDRTSIPGLRLRLVDAGSPKLLRVLSNSTKK